MNTTILDNKIESLCKYILREQDRMLIEALDRIELGWTIDSIKGRVLCIKRPDNNKVYILDGKILLLIKTLYRAFKFMGSLY